MSLADLSSTLSNLQYNPTFNMGLGIMAASGPSLMPHSLGQSLASGIQSAQAAREKAMQAQLMNYQLQQAGLMNGILQRATGMGQSNAQPSNLNAPSTNAGDAPMLASANGTPGQSYVTPGMQTSGQSSVDPVSSALQTPGGALQFVLDKQGFFNRTMPAPTDFVKNLQAAGISPSSTIGRQLIQANIAKQNYMTPTRITSGGGLYDPATGRIMMTPAAASPGTQNIQLADGSWANVPVQGGLQGVQNAATAQASGRAAFAPMTYTTPDGVTHTTTQAQFAGATGASAPPAPTPDQQVQALAAQATDMAKNGVPQDVAQAWLQNKVKALGIGYQPAQPQGAQAPGVAGPSPGFVAGQGDLAKNNVQDFAETQDNGKEAALRMNVLDNVINLSQQGIKTGPGSDWQNHVLGMAANIPGLSMALSGVQGNVAKFQEMQKFLNQAGMRSWQAAGGTQTDSQLNAAQHANPNSAQFPQALQTVARWVKAGDLASQSKANAQAQWMQANGRDISKLDQFESEWRQHYDPLVFQLQTMAPEDAAAKIKSLSPREAKSLIADRQWMMPYMQANP